MNSKSKLYDNYKMIHPNGRLMCYCNEKRARWYVKMNLGYIKNDSLFLTFTPNGEGEPDLLLTKKPNICVITGSTEKLSKHHIVPYCYRKHFKNEFKSRNSLDVVAINRKVHDEYEVFATELKKKLDDLLISDLDKQYYKAFNFCKGFIKNIIPNARYIDPYIFIKKQIKYEEYMELYKFTDDTLLSNILVDNNYKVIVDILGPEQLTILWKLHFIKYAKPNFLNSGWSPLQIKRTKHTSEIYIYKGDESFVELLKKIDLYDIYLEYEKCERI